VTELEQFARDLYAAAPGLREATREDADPDPEMPTVWMGDAGRAVAHALGNLPDDARRAVFGVVERAMTSGSEQLSTWVATGLLEALAGAVSRHELDPGLLAGLLGPESRAYIDAYDEFTLGRSSLDPS
jgi:hypothetical protein